VNRVVAGAFQSSSSRDKAVDVPLRGCEACAVSVGSDQVVTDAAELQARYYAETAETYMRLHDEMSTGRPSRGSPAGWR
jgi:hypothetical protein